jgi:hypothetical protein
MQQVAVQLCAHKAVHKFPSQSVDLAHTLANAVGAPTGSQRRRGFQTRGIESANFAAWQHSLAAVHDRRHSASHLMLLRASQLVRRFSAMPSAATPQIAAASARVVYQPKVPSDIDVSQSVEPLHISKIAADAGV